MNELEVAICPRCASPFVPGADYCTHCGGQLGIAETTLPYIPVPNSARFHDEIAPGPTGLERIRPLFRSVLVFVLVLVVLDWVLYMMYVFGGHEGIGGFLAAVLLAAMVASGAWLYFTLAARRSRSGELKK